MFYCPHRLAEGNQIIQIREKTLEFSQMVLSYTHINIFWTDYNKQKPKASSQRQNKWSK